jgi:S1-C subfamily serine protease
MATSLPARADDQSDGLQIAMKIEAALTGVAEKTSKAVVVITNKQKPGARQYQQFQQIPPEFRRFFGIPEQPFEGHRQPPRDDRPKAVGLGSGMLIRGDGYIVTNNHVIENSDALEVRLQDGRVFDSAKGDDQVKIVGVDKDTDIAVLLIGGGKLRNLPTIPFADSDQIQVGQYAIAVGVLANLDQYAIAVGAPFNLDYSVTIGHVSQKGRHGMRMTSYENYIQTDASINPGNSGGPLVNIHGEMIGVNQFIMTGGGSSRGNIGLGFAIPSNLVNRVSADIIENGAVVRPFLGISMQPMTDVLRKRYGVKKGVLIEDVVEGQAAEKAGIEPGDVVTKIGDKDVGSPHELLFAVLSYKPGDKVKLTVVRDGKPKVFTVIARKRDGSVAQMGGSQGGSVEGLGLTLQATDGGLVVTGIANNSPASRAEPELEIGDTIILVNGQKVRSHDDVTKALKKTKNDVVLLYVDRQQGGKYLIGIPLGNEK